MISLEQQFDVLVVFDVIIDGSLGQSPEDGQFSRLHLHTAFFVVVVEVDVV